MRNLKTLLLLLLSAAMLVLCACVQTPPDDPVCTTHVDANGDGKCDECGEDMTPEHTCADSDGDNKCDTCGNAIEKAPCEECTDSDGDGKCDECGGEVVAEELVLIKNGKAQFNIVIPSSVSGDMMIAVNGLVKDLKALKIDVNVVDDEEETVQDCEIIVGEIKTRGEEYQYDMHDYGNLGYVIDIVGSKIVIIGGSNSATLDAIKAFKSDILGIKSDTKTLKNITVTTKNSIKVDKNNYRVDKITLFGEDIKDYTIAADKKVASEKNAATDLQKLLYEKTGYWLEIVSHDEADKSIVFKQVEKTGGEGFKATFAEGKIEFISEYSTSLKKEAEDFFSSQLTLSKGTLELGASNSYTKNVRDVYYKDFGAKGDGRTDDSEAIRKAHEFANEGGHTVCADKGATYYIGAIEKAIPVRTNVNWGSANFIIDDSKIDPDDEIGGVKARSVFIFSVLPDENVKNPTFTSTNSAKIKEINENGGIDKKTITKLDLGLGYPAMLKVHNSNHKNYIRYGANENDGAAQVEMILIDAEGNIDSSTPFMFDYTEVTMIYTYRIDAESITVSGGRFTTKANRAPTAYTSYSRGIQVSRSNTIMKGIKHYIEGEGETGAPYGGFGTVQNAYNVLYEECVFSSHKTYYEIKNGSKVGNGTYDISAGHSINITWKNCDQANFFNADGSLVEGNWGVMGSSYCKNLKFDNSKLTRFDAHNGVWNVELIDSTLSMIRIDGGGTFLMDNCHIYSNTLVQLREDYGGFWYGDLIIKDVTMHTSSAVNLVTNTWYNHDFGYPTELPTNIVIDGLKITGNNNANLFHSNYLTQTNSIILDEIDEGKNAGPNVNKTTPPKTVTIKNNTQNIKFNIPDPLVYPFFADTEFTEVPVEA